MIKKFIRERISWILMFLFLIVLLALIAYLDPTLSLQSIIYYIFLSLVIFTVFLFIRYQKETTFYRKINERTDDLDTSEFPEPHSPFETVTYQNIIDQAEHLKQLESNYRLEFEQEKDELLSWIHEVKTPLTAMQLIIDRIEDPSLKQDLNYEWIRIHLLLDQQLHKKRMAIIENDLYIEKTNLSPLVNQEIRSLKSWCIHKGIGFDINLEVQEVLTDGKWLAFIIRQILSNAIKYSENTDIHITSQMENEHVSLTIRDEGRGIDTKDLPRIFDKGFTSTAQHQDQAATGMGLYLSKKVADAMHINIDVESNLGEGTTFNLIFPIKNDFVDTISEK